MAQYWPLLNKKDKIFNFKFIWEINYLCKNFELPYLSRVSDLVYIICKMVESVFGLVKNSAYFLKTVRKFIKF
jgi:tRNA(His) 5'-end guanylyltransferase